MLVKREAPGFSVPIHAGNVLLYCFIIEPEPYTIIIVDLQENKQQSRAQPCHPVTMETGGATSSLAHTHAHTHTRPTPLRLQEKSPIKWEDSNLFRQGLRNSGVLIFLLQRWLFGFRHGCLLYSCYCLHSDRKTIQAWQDIYGESHVLVWYLVPGVWEGAASPRGAALS